MLYTEAQSPFFWSWPLKSSTCLVLFHCDCSFQSPTLAANVS